MRKHIAAFAGLSTLALFAASPAFALSVPATDAYGVANGDHFHSSAGVAAVGYWGGEETRGVMEFDLGGLDLSMPLMLSMTVADASALSYENDGLYTGDFNLIAYAADGVVEYGDYASTGALIGSFSISSIGDLLEIDVSAAAGLGGAFLGFVLDPTSPDGGGYFETVFSSLTLSGNESSPGASVPLPAGAGLLVMGLAAFGAARARRKTA